MLFSQKPEYLAKNPLGKVPVLETAEGFLSESNAILLYVARNTPLEGATDFTKAKVKQWLDFVAFELEPYFISLIMPVFGYKAIDPAEGARNTAEVTFKLNLLEDHFKSNTYLVGGALTVADINLANYIQGTFTYLYGEDAR